MARGKRIAFEEEPPQSVVEIVKSGQEDVPVNTPPAERPAVAASRPIYEIDGITDDEKLMLVEARVVKLLGLVNGVAVPPYIPALVYYKEGNSSPPVAAVVKVDQASLKSAWDFYKVNSPDPQPVKFLDIVRKASRNPEEVYNRIVEVRLG